MGTTPGHQVVYVKLARTGPVLLAGDLSHYQEERGTDKFIKATGRAVVDRARSREFQRAEEEPRLLRVNSDSRYLPIDPVYLPTITVGATLAGSAL